MLGDCPDHCLNNGSPWLHVICTHIQLRDIYFDLVTRLVLRFPASSGTTSVRCTYRCISYCLYDNWVLNLIGDSFQTLAPRAYVTYYQARELSGHTSPCGECVCFSTTMPLIKDATLRDTLIFLFRNTSGHTSQDRNLFLFS